MIATINETLEININKAIDKLNAKKESRLCRYLPASTSGYMHHFTFKKMKTEDPQTLENMILEYIINVDKPVMVKHKNRAPRGSRKRFNQFRLDKTDLDRLIDVARSAGHGDLIAKLMPKCSLSQIKKELVKSIRKNEVNVDLWSYYVDAVTEKTPTNILEDSTNNNFADENKEFSRLIESLKK